MTSTLQWTSSEITRNDNCSRIQIKETHLHCFLFLNFQSRCQLSDNIATMNNLYTLKPLPHAYLWVRDIIWQTVFSLLQYEGVYYVMSLDFEAQVNDWKQIKESWTPRCVVWTHVLTDKQVLQIDSFIIFVRCGFTEICDSSTLSHTSRWSLNHRQKTLNFIKGCKRIKQSSLYIAAGIQPFNKNDPMGLEWSAYCVLMFHKHNSDNWTWRVKAQRNLTYCRKESLKQSLQTTT